MFKIITIPFDRNTKGFDDEILSRYVVNKEVKQWKAEFFSDGGNSYWTVFLECDPMLKESGHAEEKALTDAEKQLLLKLKEWRKDRAEKDGVPVYVIGTNKEFMDIAKSAPKTMEVLGMVKGFGKAKLSKYGKDIVGIVQAFYEPAS